MVENGRAIAANLRLSRPDALEWQMMIVGSAAEIAGYALVSPPLLVGANALDVVNTWRVYEKQQKGDATWADVFYAGIGVVPGATPRTLSTHIDLTVIQWVTPWDTGY